MNTPDRDVTLVVYRMTVMYNPQADADNPGIPPTAGQVMAYCSVRMVFGDGYELTMNDVRLAANDRQRPIVVMPNEPRRAKCASCNGKNTFNAKFCNWCGIKLPFPKRADYHDLVVPGNYKTRELIRQAVLVEYGRQTRSDFFFESPESPTVPIDKS